MIGKRKWTSRILGFAVFVLMAVSSLSPVSRAAAAEGPAIDAPAALLMDVKSGQILYQKNADERRYPASTTKIMTLLLTMETVESGQKKLTDIVPVPLEAYNIEGSSVWLDPKEKFTLQDMIKFIAVASANDACVATAIFIAGSEQAFVQRMNEKARQLGMTNTHYTDTNGLHNPDHYTTARDLAIVARELITKYPQILEYTKIKEFDLRGGKNHFENTNRLIGKYDGMDGLKTGFTDQAGYNLVSTAERDGFRLLGVILGARDDQQRQIDTTKLLDYGFSTYQSQRVAEKDKPLQQKAVIPDAKTEEVEVAPVRDVYVTLPKGDGQGVEMKFVWNNVSAPIHKGQVLGEMQLVKNGQVLNTVEVAATQDVEKGSWIRLFFRKLFNSIAGSIQGLFNKL